MSAALPKLMDVDPDPDPTTARIAAARHGGCARTLEHKHRALSREERLGLMIQHEVTEHANA